MLCKELLNDIARERPTGTKINEEIVNKLEKMFQEAGYEMVSLPFDCQVWREGKAQLVTNEIKWNLKTSPFSKAFKGSSKADYIETLSELKYLNLTGKIAVLGGSLAERTLQPKDFPFYYPEEDKAVIELLEQKAPQAVIALTDQSQLSGMNPFPLFEDGNFLIPSAYMHVNKSERLRKCIRSSQEFSLTIDSEVSMKRSRQLVARSKGIRDKKKIVICAHMDSKYNTSGALDNAAGLCVLMQLMERLKRIECPVEFVPFDSEEYFGADGEVTYLNWHNKKQEEILLLINIDSPCHLNTQTAVSYYNLGEEEHQKIGNIIRKSEGIEEGESWYAGDHCAFVFQGIPCLAIASSDLFNGGLSRTHTPEDTIETVDQKLIVKTADFLAEVIKNWEAE